MISRGFGHAYTDCSRDYAPPPLHVYSPDAIHAAWHPLTQERPTIVSQHPGPVMVRIPQQAADELGDDPSDPSRRAFPPMPCTGMIGRLHPATGGQ